MWEWYVNNVKFIKEFKILQFDLHTKKSSKQLIKVFNYSRDIIYE